MDPKFGRNKKHKYSNEEKLAPDKDKNTRFLINIAQEHGSK